MCKENQESTKEQLLDILRNHKLSSNEFFACVREWAELSPIELTKSFLEEILQEGDLSKNPFKSKLRNPLLGLGNDYEDLAKIFINKINGYKSGINEYIPLIQVMENHIFYEEIDIRNIVTRAEDINFFKFGLFNYLKDSLLYSVFFIYDFVFKGVPLYKKNDLDEFIKVPDSDNQFIYFFMSGYYQEQKSSGRYLEWAKEYFFKNSHLEIHKHFFEANFDEYQGTNYETIKLRRSAFRKHIGEKDVFFGAQENKSAIDKTISHGYHETKLMRIQKEVLERYYGNQFDIADRNT
ncbi:hypothetical protein [Nitrosomonas sp. Nm33]|uniref:hypothetical protein n=1 Tax=Nitrosomonas sp. Nm33 TaxID=133724 RepID=UPI0008994E05|nr:hypothetical protein [Nitrosomonas sp. Nm33]SDZ02997.1 hypothetical protein SAMN05421755_10876 [Nitrosomonas sp. Nm33]